MQLTAQQTCIFLERVAATVKIHREQLTALDSAIGDADHGANLDRGFTAVVAKLPTVAGQDIGAILKMVGMTLVSTVGGASGPLYGTAFLRAGTTIGDKHEIDADTLVTALEAALRGIMERGKAQPGEKTMIDAIAPGIAALKASLADGTALPAALQAGVAAMEEGVAATIPMLATKGRASYLGERSIGHQDPGATSALLMAKALLETINDQS